MSDAKPWTNEERMAEDIRSFLVYMRARKWGQDTDICCVVAENLCDDADKAVTSIETTLAERDERIEELEAEVEESDEGDDIRMRMAKNLTSIANALRGEPPELTTWSWHDLAEVASSLAESQRLADEFGRANDKRLAFIRGHGGKWQAFDEYRALSAEADTKYDAYKKHRAEEGKK